MTFAPISRFAITLLLGLASAGGALAQHSAALGKAASYNQTGPTTVAANTAGPFVFQIGRASCRERV